MSEERLQQAVARDVAGPQPHHQGLECTIGRVQFALPVESVDQVVEYDVAPPPPLASPWIGGLGLHAGRVLVSLSLVSKKASSQPGHRTAKGVLLRVPDSKVSWVLEVGSVAAFVNASVSTRGVQVGQARLPAWIAAASTPEGRALGWIHAKAMIEELSHGADELK
jgi:chemotaxis signal transduction protein